ncbi:soluble lytic murein transglycosylase [Caulobacter ginsengisoli]|uniref:Soluble lytic murein transglycosylase n=1 Tax=Caulobacter ginsengisoli TaxID=400775 RepID=A0ABU0IQQ1_9CAUL|nr:lytic transglycosylase domain-containing protein [Caulobacter ginsengisoli]MDQ0463277.1 soluble lytic murein transglycosylase [Caulobacter ginsengisoli]
MGSRLRKVLLTTVLAAVAGGFADAQTTYGSGGAPQLITTPQIAYRQPVSDSDIGYLKAALTAAKSGDGDRIRLSMDAISDPLTRKIALWALADGAPDSLSFFEADSARRDLAGWPRSAKRQANAEQKLETSGLDPARIVAWFGGSPPETARGAIALAAALNATGHQAEATNLIREWWNTRLFEADDQRSMRARFATVITTDDDIRRTDMLLYGQQGPAARDMVAILPADLRPVADARLALRGNSAGANALVANLSAEQRKDPGLIFEQAAYFRRRGLDSMARSLTGGFAPPPTPEVAAKAWPERRAIVVAGLQNGDYRAAYNAANDAGMTVGPDAAEAEFYAGWIALTKLKQPETAAAHFAILSGAGTSPITKGRGYYWQGRAAEAMGDRATAAVYYQQGSQYITSFYGQLCAEKAGITRIELGKDPDITPADRARFEGREPVRAARVLAEAGLKDQFRAFVLAIDDTLPTAAEAALLVDLAKNYGDVDLAMRASRTAAQRGFSLPERGYPMILAPNVPGGAEPAFVFSITRQESNFDPRAKSAPGARGLMQLMPATGATTARALGEPYSVDRLYEGDFNLRLGARYLGDMISTFSGSYIMAAAAYNAGPGRPAQWSAVCGDPRGSGTDPLDFIECIPFVETRNYVMRTLETTQVYRARLNGGSAPLTLSADLKRGSWMGYQPSAGVVAPSQDATR